MRPAVLAVVLLGVALGCGGPKAPRYAITGTAAVLAEGEAAFYPPFMEQSDRCEAENPTFLEGYRACLGLWLGAQEALQTVATSAYLAEEAYETYRGVDDERWRDALACARDALATALTLFADLGLDWPGARGVLEDYVGFTGRCAEVTP